MHVDAKLLLFCFVCCEVYIQLVCHRDSYQLVIIRLKQKKLTIRHGGNTRTCMPVQMPHRSVVDRENMTRRYRNLFLLFPTDMSLAESERCARNDLSIAEL